VIQLDTHSLIWLSLQPEKLSADAKAAIEESVQSEEKIVISVMTLWEVAQLVMRGRIFLRVPLETFLKTIEENYEVLPLNRFIAIEAARLPASFPKDPMDRLITATARWANLTLITADRAILSSNACRLLW
jgi:PIN domain nuclease of toxin-antitoxin system